MMVRSKANNATARPSRRGDLERRRRQMLWDSLSAKRRAEFKQLCKQQARRKWAGLSQNAKNLTRLARIDYSTDEEKAEFEVVASEHGTVAANWEKIDRWIVDRLTFSAAKRRAWDSATSRQRSVAAAALSAARGWRLHS